MINKIANIDYQMVSLNASSAGALISEVIRDNANSWAVGFLIVTIGVLNLAKAYSTIKNKKNNED